jgi:hypothetical protein
MDIFLFGRVHVVKLRGVKNCVEGKSWGAFEGMGHHNNSARY